MKESSSLLDSAGVLTPTLVQDLPTVAKLILFVLINWIHLRDAAYLKTVLTPLFDCRGEKSPEMVLLSKLRSLPQL